jgi:hypothetical protein
MLVESKVEVYNIVELNESVGECTENSKLDSASKEMPYIHCVFSL